jgi:two-component system NarL family sensor kinase
MISLGRPPIESPEPVVKFAAVRLLLALSALVALAVVTDFPNHGRLTAVVLGVALPWAIAMLYVSRRWPEIALNPLVAVGDIAVIALTELAVPQVYAPARFLALFFITAHAQFQGTRGGLMIAALASATIVPIGALTDGPIEGELLAFYETLFVVCAFAGAITAGNIRTAETAGRLRAREVSRRMIETESEIRRRVADSLHDGPVQELVSLDMILAAVPAAIEHGEIDKVRDLLREAQSIAERNIRALRDEIVGLGPYAFRELSFETAVVECVPVWRRRFGIDVRLDIEQITLAPELTGPLFLIAQEAVTNAGRHANASIVSVSLTTAGTHVELRVTDDGHGFDDLAPAMSEGSGHIGLASMRERAELINGRLSIESSKRGTTVKVQVPLGRAQSPRTELAKDAGRP